MSSRLPSIAHSTIQTVSDAVAYMTLMFQEYGEDVFDATCPRAYDNRDTTDMYNSDGSVAIDYWFLPSIFSPSECTVVDQRLHEMYALEDSEGWSLEDAWMSVIGDTPF